MTPESARAVVDRAVPAEGAPLVAPKVPARLLGCSAKTVYRMALAGRLPLPVKLSSQAFRYERDALRAALLVLLTAAPEGGEEGGAA